MRNMKGVTPEEEIVFGLIAEQYSNGGTSGWGYFLYDFEKATARLREIAARKEAAGEANPVEKYMDHARQAEALRSLADKDILEIDYAEELFDGNSVSYRWHCGYEWSCALTKGLSLSPEKYSQFGGRYYINTGGKRLNAISDDLVEKYDATLSRTFDHIVVRCNGNDFLFSLPKFPVPQGIIDYATDKTRLNKPVTQEELVQAGILPDNKRPRVKDAFRNSSTFADALRPFITLEPRAIIVNTTAKLTESEYRLIANK